MAGLTPNIQALGESSGCWGSWWWQADARGQAGRRRALGPASSSRPPAARQQTLVLRTMSSAHPWKRVWKQLSLRNTWTSNISSFFNSYTKSISEHQCKQDGYPFPIFQTLLLRQCSKQKNCHQCDLNICNAFSLQAWSLNKRLPPHVKVPPPSYFPWSFRKRRFLELRRT